MSFVAKVATRYLKNGVQCRKPTCLQHVLKGMAMQFGYSVCSLQLVEHLHHKKQHHARPVVAARAAVATDFAYCCTSLTAPLLITIHSRIVMPAFVNCWRMNLNWS